MNSPKIAATSPPATTENQNGVWMTEKGQMMSSRIHIISFWAAGSTHSAETYAPMAMKPACPSENMPVNP